MTPDGTRVYAAAFLSGNQTTIITPKRLPPASRRAPARRRPTPTAVPAPPTAVIVKFDGSTGVDADGQAWDDDVRFSLPDKDVFVIDATASPPAQLAGSAWLLHRRRHRPLQHGVNPVTGKVYVSNTDAQQHSSFEGAGIFAGGTAVRGHFDDNRITVLDPLRRRHAAPPQHAHRLQLVLRPGPQRGERPEPGASRPAWPSPATAQTLYVAALGSSKVGIFDTAALEDGTYMPDVAEPGDGERRRAHGARARRGARAALRAHALRRLHLDRRHPAPRRGRRTSPMYNPEPPSVTAGRRFLYDATFALGPRRLGLRELPRLRRLRQPRAGRSATRTTPRPPTRIPSRPRSSTRSRACRSPRIFNPMKGPMTTQSLRGMATTDPCTGAATGPPPAPRRQRAARQRRVRRGRRLREVPGRLHRPARHAARASRKRTCTPSGTSSSSSSTRPTRSATWTIRSRPTSRRGTTSSPARARWTRGSSPAPRCHTLDPQGNAQYGVEFPGFFGTSGFSVVDPERRSSSRSRTSATCTRRWACSGWRRTRSLPFDSFAFMGDQVRGFGYIHDGSCDTVFGFHGTAGFTTASSPDGFPL